MLHKLFETETRSEPEETIAVSSGEAVDWLVGGNSGSNAEGATLAAAYSAISVIATAIGQIPLEVKQRSGNKIEVLHQHTLTQMFRLATNPWQTSSEYRQLLMWNTLVEGNGVSRILRTNKGDVKELIQENSKLCALLYKEGDYRYQITNEEGHTFLERPDEVIHVKCLGQRTVYGKWAKSPIAQTRDTFTTGLEAQKFGKGFFESGGKPAGVFTPIAGIKGDAWNKLTKAWQTLMSSGKRNILLPSELKYQAITIPPEDSQFLDTMKFNRSQIAGIYNVPPHMIGDLERATFSNIAEQSLSFVRNSLMPWVVLLEQEFNRKLLTESERRAGMYLSFDLSGLLRGTPTERAEFYNSALTAGWMNRNEVRVKEGMNPEDGLDEFFVSVNQVHDTANTDNGENDESTDGKTNV